MGITGVKRIFDFDFIFKYVKRIEVVHPLG